MINQFLRSTNLWKYTLYSSLIKIYIRNAGSRLGLLWEPLSTLLVSTILTLVWIKVLNIQEDFLHYFIYVYTGMVIWGVLAGAVSNLCATLVKNAKNITSRTLPIFSYIFEDILISFIPFLMSLPILIVIISLAGYELSFFNLLTFIGGLLLVVTVAFAFSMSIGLSAFFVGDIRQIITSVMRLSFLVTPVIWKPERLGDSQDILLFNPFYGYLHILRNSLIGEKIDQQYVIQASVLTFSLLIIGCFMFVVLSKRIQQRALLL